MSHDSANLPTPTNKLLLLIGLDIHENEREVLTILSVARLVHGQVCECPLRRNSKSCSYFSSSTQGWHTRMLTLHPDIASSNDKRAGPVHDDILSSGTEPTEVTDEPT
jgi:hypothetical protein